MKAERQLGYEYKRVLLCQILCVYDKINVYLMFVWHTLVESIQGLQNTVVGLLLMYNTSTE